MFSSLEFHKKIIENNFVNHTKAKTLINPTNTNVINQTNDNKVSVPQIIKFIIQIYIVSSELNPLNGGIHAIANVEIRKITVNNGIIFAIQPSLE